MAWDLSLEAQFDMNYARTKSGFKEGPALSAGESVDNRVGRYDVNYPPKRAGWTSPTRRQREVPLPWSDHLLTQARRVIAAGGRSER